MGKFGLAVILGFGCVGFVSAQVRGRPNPTPLTQTQQAINRANEINSRSELLRNSEKSPFRSGKDRKIYNESVVPLYRKPTKDEKKIMAPDSRDLTTYGRFARGKGAGITKLVADIGCARNPKIVNASVACAKYTMPGAGSAFSFRFGSYRIQHLADLNFKKDTFQALGVLTHGILVNLGDVGLDGVDLKADGLKFVTGFKPVKKMANAAKFAEKLTKGVKKDGFLYASVLPVKLNSTYVLRSIAYNGLAKNIVRGIVYNELDFDKRKDVIIAFRVVRLNPKENVTIVWKRLKSKKSPKIKN